MVKAVVFVSSRPRAPISNWRRLVHNPKRDIGQERMYVSDRDWSLEELSRRMSSFCKSPDILVQTVPPSAALPVTCRLRSSENL